MHPNAHLLFSGTKASPAHSVTSNRVTHLCLSTHTQNIPQFHGLLTPTPIPVKGPEGLALLQTIGFADSAAPRRQVQDQTQHPIFEPRSHHSCPPRTIPVASKPHNQNPRIPAITTRVSAPKSKRKHEIDEDNTPSSMPQSSWLSSPKRKGNNRIDDVSRKEPLNFLQ
jgi:hypothetical protein